MTRGRPPFLPRARTIPEICKELGGIRPSTLYHYLHADGSLKTPGRDLLEIAGKEEK